MIDTAQQVAQQAQHIAGLSAEAVTLLKLFFALVAVTVAAVITALVRTRGYWLPVVRGLARDHAESDPKKGNGSLRDDFNKSITDLQREFNRSLGSLQLALSETGGALVRSTASVHERIDGIVHRFENFVPNRQYDDMLQEIAKERLEARNTLGRELARSSTPEERERFKSADPDKA